MSNSLFGMSMALLSALSWAVAVVLYKKLGEKLEPISMTTLNAFLCFFFCL